MDLNVMTQDNFENEVLQAKMPVVVDFFADWCGPCKMAAPVLEKLAEEFKDKVKIVKVDIDKAQDLAGQYKVMSIPTVIAFKNGEEVDRKVGFPGEEGYKKMIEAVI